jgi:hypothetical protein
VRLLIDANLSPRIAAALSKAGLESVHVCDVGLLTAPDRSILDYAAANALVIVSADSDFGELAGRQPRGNATFGRSSPVCGPAYTGRAGSPAGGKPASGSRRPGSGCGRNHRAGPDEDPVTADCPR